VTIKRARQGFAVLDPELRRSIASKGGKAVHAQGKAHEFTSDEAREAGKKGGEAVSRDRQHMARIGRLGGRNSKRGRAKATE
jgi:general stress protein YciG